MLTITRAMRYHDISCGHRVHGHENKCAHLHGHNYRFWLTVEGPLDVVGRVMDFGVINTRLCQWLEENWDHKFLADEDDPVMGSVQEKLNHMYNYMADGEDEDVRKAAASFVFVPFNPTAENMAEYLISVVGPQQLQGTGVRLVSVRIDETRKCSAEVRLV